MSDLAFYLASSESDMVNNNASVAINLDDYTRGAGSGNFAPENSSEVLQNVIPRISYLTSVIRKNYQMYPLI